MTEYHLTPAARLDLFEIWEFIAARDGPSAADGVVDDIRRAFARLAEFPHIGHTRLDLSDESLRVWPVHSFLIIYRARTRPIQIVRIISGHRDLLPLFTG